MIDTRVINYAQGKYSMNVNNANDKSLMRALETAFISGINSPVNQILKIESQIELLKEINYWSDKANKLKELENQLTELQKQL